MKKGFRGMVTIISTGNGYHRIMKQYLSLYHAKKYVEDMTPENLLIEVWDGRVKKKYEFTLDEFMAWN